MDFHHVGMVVKNIEESFIVYENFGYQMVGNQIYVDHIQKVRITFVYKENHPLVELIEPISTDSPAMNVFLKNGSTLYHSCFIVEDLQKSIAELRKNGFLMVSSPVGAVAFNGRRICFMFSKLIGLIELLENEG